MWHWCNMRQLSHSMMKTSNQTTLWARLECHGEMRWWHGVTELLRHGRLTSVNHGVKRGEAHGGKLKYWGSVTNAHILSPARLNVRRVSLIRPGFVLGRKVHNQQHSNNTTAAANSRKLSIFCHRGHILPLPPLWSLCNPPDVWSLFLTEVHAKQGANLTLLWAAIQLAEVLCSSLYKPRCNLTQQAPAVLFDLLYMSVYKKGGETTCVASLLLCDLFLCRFHVS